MANPHIDWWNDRGEQNLLQDLITEFISTHAYPAIYLPATLRREDTLYTEDVLRQFTHTYDIDVYIQNVQGWDGQGDFLSKFGIRINDSLNVLISRQTFDGGNIHGQTRPMEGDLVMFPPPMDAVFEIKFVEHEKSAGQFFPLGGLYYYDVKLELYTASHENINPANTDINIASVDGYALDLVFEAGGTGTFAVGELVYQGDSPLDTTASGIVGTWDADTRTLRVINIVGAFVADSIVRGGTSMSAWMLDATPDTLDNVNDAMDDNRYLQTMRDDVIDTTETNPITGL